MIRILFNSDLIYWNIRFLVYLKFAHLSLLLETRISVYLWREKHFIVNTEITEAGAIENFWINILTWILSFVGIISDDFWRNNAGRGKVWSA